MLLVIGIGGRLGGAHDIRVPRAARPYQVGKGGSPVPCIICTYCNAGYVILGRIVEKIARKSFERNLHERILDPLGMDNSGYDRNRYLLEKRASGYTRGSFGYSNADSIDMDSSPGAAGALYSTVEDLFRWDRALYTDQLFDSKHRALLFTPNRDVPEVKAAGGRAQSRYGYGWNIYTRTHPVTQRRTRVVNHGGAINGFRAIEWFQAKGRKAAWGGANLELAQQLLQDGRVDDAIRLMEFDLKQAPGKVWLLRKTAQACLDHGRPEKALALSEQGLKIRPDDESFATIRAEARQDLEKP